MAKVEVKMPEDFLLKLSSWVKKRTKSLSPVWKQGWVVLECEATSAPSLAAAQIPFRARANWKHRWASPRQGGQQGVHNVKIGFNERRRSTPPRVAQHYTITNAMIVMSSSTANTGSHPSRLKPARTSSASPQSRR